MQSLISASTIGFDLSRMDGGATTAELLATLLAVPAEEWVTLAPRLPRESITRVAARARAMSVADLRPSVRDLAGVDPERAVQVLRHAPVGTLSGLLECVRTDVLVPGRDDLLEPDYTPAPEAVVNMATDAVCACYLRGLLSERDRRALAAGWLAARRQLPVRPADLGPQGDTVRRLLDRVATLDPAGVLALNDAAERMRTGGGSWAAAMHAMTWAVHVAGRIRVAAAAQLHLVQAIDLAGVPVGDRATGVWNVLSGAVQAVVVRDLAGADQVLELIVPTGTALGIDWLIES
jgi:hypothetical protein